MFLQNILIVIHFHQLKQKWQLGIYKSQSATISMTIIQSVTMTSTQSYSYTLTMSYDPIKQIPHCLHVYIKMPIFATTLVGFDVIRSVLKNLLVLFVVELQQYF